MKTTNCYLEAKSDIKKDLKRKKTARHRLYLLGIGGIIMFGKYLFLPNLGIWSMPMIIVYVVFGLLFLTMPWSLAPEVADLEIEIRLKMQSLDIEQREKNYKKRIRDLHRNIESLDQQGDSISIMRKIARTKEQIIHEQTNILNDFFYQKEIIETLENTNEFEYQTVKNKINYLEQEIENGNNELADLVCRWDIVL